MSSDSWLLEFKSFVIFIPWKATQKQHFQVCSFFWGSLTWEIRGEFRKRSKLPWYFKNELLASEEHSVFCFDASLVSYFGMTFVDFFKLSKGLLWYEFWISIGKLLELETALFLNFFDIKGMFVVSAKQWVLSEVPSNKETAACLGGNSFEGSFLYLISTLDYCWECRS